MSWKNDALVGGVRAARSFRVGLEAQAAEHLLTVIDSLDRAPDELAKALDILFGEIADAQLRRDFLRVADLLEFELPRGLDEVVA
ncbi:MAG: hypothetical protein ACI8PQ_002720 [Planctomycetota bacterium]|jgi:hypothetical protein